jgi:hypothetical protein
MADNPPRRPTSSAPPPAGSGPGDPPGGGGGQPPQGQQPQGQNTTFGPQGNGASPRDLGRMARSAGGHTGPLGLPSGGMWQPPGTPHTPPPGISMFSGPGRFQTQVFYQPAPAVEGDFADHNPRTSVNAGPGGLVAGVPGVMVGRFAWFDPDSPLDPNDAPKVCISWTDDPQPVVGFVHREQQGLITHWLGGAGMWIPEGFMVTLHQTGGFFVRNNGDDRATLGQRVFASMEDGSIAFGDPGAAIADHVETKWFAVSQGDPGMLVKMSSWPLG